MSMVKITLASRLQLSKSLKRNRTEINRVSKQMGLTGPERACRVIVMLGNQIQYSLHVKG
jgi:hypothetical protein